MQGLLTGGVLVFNKGSTLCIDDEGHLTGLSNKPVIVLGDLSPKGCKGCFLNALPEVVPFLRGRVVLVFCSQSVLEGLGKLFHFLWELHAGGMDAGFALLFGTVELLGL